MRRTTTAPPLLAAASIACVAVTPVIGQMAPPKVQGHDHDHDAEVTRQDHEHDPTPITLPTLSPGWSWEVEPITHVHGWKTAGFVRFVPSGAIMLDLGPQNRITTSHVELVNPTLSRGSRAEFRLYLLGAAGRPLLPNFSNVATSEEMNIHREYFLETDPATITGIGLAVLDVEGRRRLAEEMLAGTPDARVLPLPVEGEAYPFDLPDLDGESVSSESLAGKVVVFHAWTARSRPSLEVAAILAGLHGRRDLVLIGINFDSNVETARAAASANGITWTQVHGPTAAAGTSGLWNKVTGLGSLPRTFIVGRDGTLRHDLTDAEGLDTMILRALDAPPTR